MPASKTPSTAFSKMENTFIASSTLKRNRRYLDIERINGREQKDHLHRRRPRTTSQSVDAKINRSFSSSTAALTSRLDHDITKFRSRLNSQQRPQTARSFYSRQEQSPPAKSIRGVGIGQYISRQQYYRPKSKLILDERLFNNYKEETPDEVHTVDMGRGPERNFDNSLKYINDIEYNTQKLYQNYYYKKTNMDTKVNYKKQSEQDRYFFVPKRPENNPTTQLSPKAVKRAQQAVKSARPVDSFYMNSGRELPCQLKQRSGNALTSHWRNEENVIQRPFPEYSVRRMKQRLSQERKEKISASKKPHFDRRELCDRKYFMIQGQAY